MSLKKQRTGILIDRVKQVLGKSAGDTTLSAEEFRILRRDVAELAGRLAQIRKANPDLPVPTISSQVYRLLKTATENYRVAVDETATQARKAANF